jgi:tetratricopeptide (TPR) repeat protein
MIKIKSAIKVVTLTVFFLALIAAPPVVPVFAAGGGGGGGGPPGEDLMRPSPPAAAPDSKARHTNRRAKQKQPGKQSLFDDPAFAQRYRAAYATIYDHNDYGAAIEQLKALGHDDYANVANLIGYSYRKLGDYRLSQIWYERALKSDPNHVLTWQYYGLWQIEQGNREQAQYHLSRIAAICGTDCEHYRSLAAALEQPPGTGLVY